MYKVICTVLLLMILVSCSSGNTENQTSSTSPATSTLKSTFEQETGSELSFEIANKEQGLSPNDFDTVYAVCKSFLNNFYAGIKPGNIFDTDIYCDNAEFKEYIAMKMEKIKQLSNVNSADVSYGLTDIEWLTDDESVFVEISAVSQHEYGASSAAHKLIIKNVNGHLSVRDWYSGGGNIGILDEVARGKNIEMNKPDIWEDSSFTDEVFEKISKYDSR